MCRCHLYWVPASGPPLQTPVKLADPRAWQGTCGPLPLYFLAHSEWLKHRLQSDTPTLMKHGRRKVRIPALEPGFWRRKCSGCQQHCAEGFLSLCVLREIWEPTLRLLKPLKAPGLCLWLVWKVFGLWLMPNSSWPWASLTLEQSAFMLGWLTQRR